MLASTFVEGSESLEQSPMEGHWILNLRCMPQFCELDQPRSWYAFCSTLAELQVVAQLSTNGWWSKILADRCVVFVPNHQQCWHGDIVQLIEDRSRVDHVLLECLFWWCGL